MALTVVLLAELVAIMLSVARYTDTESFWIELARVSLLLIWIALATTACLCSLRPRLARLGAAGLTVGSFLAVLAVTAFIAESTWWIGHVTLDDALTGAQQFFPRDHASFVLGSLAVAAIVCGLLLRYFYVAHQWRINLERQAQTRVAALQARMRPHFLFNSMNTIAALTRSSPEKAEQAVEDVAELMRASLADTGHQIPFHRELHTARVYARVEAERLRERLHIGWQVDGIPEDLPIPALTLQPLLENAIYHGIERLPEGGTVWVKGQVSGDMACLTITNPVPPRAAAAGPGHRGNRMALANIRERLALISQGRAKLDTEVTEDTFAASLWLPLHPETDRR